MPMTGGLDPMQQSMQSGFGGPGFAGAIGCQPPGVFVTWTQHGFTTKKAWKFEVY